ncbi:hypothetical protein AK812_SmicGene33711 [Symbiodinium microadriaticum]|uniref:Uncharacterized protein n=1 Tax=Symbiodinium microadriaticum TaxID=2951 RepID=A0A1Q9CQU4_SYMMI|nr:hypothetical protein AK812_SmicGene33711 [Symbiodinium microadriaticum]
MSTKWLGLQCAEDIQVFTANKCADIVDKANTSGHVTEESSVSVCKETCGLLGEMLALAQMRDDFNKSSFCETMSSAHACSAAMEDFLSSDAVADLAFGHCLQGPLRVQAKMEAAVGNYCQPGRFQSVLTAAVKASDTIDTLRKTPGSAEMIADSSECYMMELERSSSHKSPAQGVAAKVTQIPQQVPAPQSQVVLSWLHVQQIPAALPQVQQIPAALPQVQQIPAALPQVQQIPAALPQVQPIPAALPQMQQIPAALPQVKRLPGVDSEAQHQVPFVHLQAVKGKSVTLMNQTLRLDGNLSVQAGEDTEMEAAATKPPAPLGPQTALPRSEARAFSVTKSCEKFSGRSKRIGAAAWACTFTGPRFSPTRILAVGRNQDLLAIVDEAKKVIASGSKEAQFLRGRCEVSVYERDFWLRRLEAMDLTMLTCISTPKRFVLLEIDDPRVRNLTLPLDILEESVASYAEYTWLKAHRRMDGKGKDLYSAAKNCYFAFRILCFGQQLLRDGRIPDLTAANAKYEVIQAVFDALSVEPGEWDVVEAIFGRLFRAELASFTGKILAARDGDKDGSGVLRAFEIGRGSCELMGLVFRCTVL